MSLVPKIILDDTRNCIRMTSTGAVIVEGLEDWLAVLTILDRPYGLVIAQDDKTGAQFEIRRIR